MTGRSGHGCFRVARNLLIDADRAAQSRPVTVPEQFAEDGRPDTSLIQVLDRELVSGALQRLSPAHRTVLVETFYYGRTLTTVARRLGIPPGTARSRLHYALQAVRPATGRSHLGRVLMDAHPPGDIPAVVGADGMTAPGQPGRLLIIVMLIAAATLDLTRCGIVLMTARHAASAAGLVAAGMAAAALSLSTARGCQNGRRWSGWATLLIGVASAPQGGRIRLSRALRDSQHRHCRPGNTSDRGSPGYPGPDHGTRPIRREPVLVDQRLTPMTALRGNRRADR
jgi:hypothetical protein